MIFSVRLPPFVAFLFLFLYGYNHKKKADDMENKKGVTIAYQEAFVYVAGDHTSALLLSQLYFWASHTTDEWFDVTQAEIERLTKISRWQQDTSREKLSDIGVLEMKRKGIPARIFYKINFEQLELLCHSHGYDMPMCKKQQLDASTPYSSRGTSEVKLSGTTQLIENTEDVLIKKQERIKEVPLADSLQKPSTKAQEEALAICQLMDEKGISNAPIATDPELLFAIESGVTKAYFEAAIASASHRKINGYKYVLKTAIGKLEDSKKQPNPQTPRPQSPKPPELKLHASHKPFSDTTEQAKPIKAHSLMNSDAAFSNPDLPPSALQVLEQAKPPKLKKSEMPIDIFLRAKKMFSAPRPDAVAR